MENQTTHKFADANQHVSSQVSDLDTKVAVAVADIAKQEEKLANTDELVEALFSKGEVEIFPIADNARFVALPGNNHIPLEQDPETERLLEEIRLFVSKQ